MARIIKNGAVVDDGWQILRPAEGETAETLNIPAGPLLLPMPVWQARREELLARQAAGEKLGLWLSPTDEPAEIADDLARFEVIGVDFPKFVDGRGYSTARLLRSRYGYQGELRAIGDVQRDQLFYQRRVGFDAFAVRPDHDIEAAVKSLEDFDAAYQYSTDAGLSLRRRIAVRNVMNPNTHPDLDNPALQASLARRTADTTTLLGEIVRDFSSVAFASSLGAEDMVLTDLILRGSFDIEIFSLDTGRLPTETYDLMAEVQRRYGLKLKLYYPRHDLIETWTRTHGINAFYESVELRKACCHIRKVEPLSRALAGKTAWITGQRAQQAETRDSLPLCQFDEANGLEKFNPLADWSEKEIWAYIRSQDVPYNALHDRHYPSIGCAPCTRAISVGEDVRAGRWWWENADTKECGLHAKAAFIDISSQANRGTTTVESPQGDDLRQSPERKECGLHVKRT